MSAPAYFVFEFTITDREGFAPYAAKVAETVAAFGGRRVVMGGKVRPVEGDAPKGSIVVLAFPDMTTAEAWYASPNYQAILGYRLASATGNAWLVEGVSPSPA
jgi:uncharacterized protein (DUF1330 family)